VTHSEDGDGDTSYRYVSFDVAGAFDGRGIGGAAPNNLTTGIKAWCVRGGSGQDVQ